MKNEDTWFLITFLAFVVATAFAMSFEKLCQFAELAGFGENRRWLLPISLDSGIVLSGWAQVRAIQNGDDSSTYRMFTLSCAFTSAALAIWTAVTSNWGQPVNSIAIPCVGYAIGPALLWWAEERVAMPFLLQRTEQKQLSSEHARYRDSGIGTEQTEHVQTEQTEHVQTEQTEHVQLTVHPQVYNPTEQEVYKAGEHDSTELTIAECTPVDTVSNERLNRVQTLLNQGFSVAQIAGELGVSRTTIYKDKQQLETSA